MDVIEDKDNERQECKYAMKIRLDSLIEDGLIQSKLGILSRHFIIIMSEFFCRLGYFAVMQIYAVPGLTSST